MGQHKVAKAIKEKHVIKFQKFDSPKSQKLTLIINVLRSLPCPYGMVLISFPPFILSIIVHRPVFGDSIQYTQTPVA